MIVGLVVFILYLYFYVGFNEISAEFGRLDYPQFSLLYSLALVAALFSLFLFSTAWQKLLNALSIKIGFIRAFQYNAVGTFVDLVIPCQTVCGEIVRVQLVWQEGRKDYGKILASAFVNRILFNIITVFGLSAGGILIFLNHSSLSGYVMGPLLFLIIGTLIYNAVLIVMMVRPGTSKKLFSGFLRFAEIVTFRRFKREKLLARAEGSLQNFETGFQIFRDDPKRLIMPTVYLLLSWFFSVLSFALVFYALDYWFLPLDFFLVAFSLTASIQGVAATLSVGTLDIFMTQFLGLYNITIGASGVAVLLVRFVVFWFQLIVGYAIIQLIGAHNLLSTGSDQKAKK